MSMLETGLLRELTKHEDKHAIRNAAIRALMVEQEGALQVTSASTSVGSVSEAYYGYSNAKPAVGTVRKEVALPSGTNISSSSTLLFSAVQWVALPDDPASQFVIPSARITLDDSNPFSFFRLPEASGIVDNANLFSLFFPWAVGSGASGVVLQGPVHAVPTAVPAPVPAARSAKTDLGKALLRYREKMKEAGGQFRSLEEILGDIEAQRRGNSE